MQKTMLAIALSLYLSNAYAKDARLQALTVDNCPQNLVEEILAGNLDLPIHIKKGDKVPFTMHSSEFVTVENGSFLVTFHDDIFIKKNRDGLLFSKDGRKWARFEELFHGNLLFSLFGNEENRAEGACIIKIDLAS